MPGMDQVEIYDNGSSMQTDELINKVGDKNYIAELLISKSLALILQVFFVLFEVLS